MHEVVTLPDGCADHGLHARRLQPGFSVEGIRCLVGWSEVHIVVSPHEWVESTQFPKGNCQVVRWIASEARHVTAAKVYTGHTKCQHIVDRHLNISPISLTVASPNSWEALWAEKVWSRQHERTKLLVVTGEQALESGLMLEGAVRVMDPLMLEL